MTFPRSLDGFDVPGAVERMLGQPALWWQALGLFVDHFAGWERAWQAMLGDDAGERRCVHALGSGAANVGAIDLEAAARALEAALAQRLAGQSAADPAALRESLRAVFRRTLSVAGQAAGRDPAGGGGRQ